MSEELKPCPFCGGKARHKTAKYNTLGAFGSKDTEKQWHGIYCPKCRIGQPLRYYFTELESQRAWNRRADNAKK